MDITTLLCFAGSALPAGSSLSPTVYPKYEACFVFYKSKLRAMIYRLSTSWRARLNRATTPGFEREIVHCGKRKSVVARAGFAHGLCQNVPGS
jgi:hypothetical protein